MSLEINYEVIALNVKRFVKVFKEFMHKIEYNDFSNEKTTAELDKNYRTDYTRAKQRIYSDC